MAHCTYSIVHLIRTSTNPDIYRVFVLPSDSCSDLSWSWDDLAPRATAYLGEVPVPEVESGALLRQYTGAYNRQGYGETSVYVKVQIDLSI